MWFGDASTSATGNMISNVTLSTTTPAVTNYGSSPSLNAPRFPAVDGAGNVWVTNRGASGISEFSSTGTLLSPVPTGTGAPGYAHAGLATANQVAIDPSGNVWAANNTTGTGGSSIFEIVGAAAPAVTPIALGLKNGTIGVRP